MRQPIAKLLVILFLFLFNHAKSQKTMNNTTHFKQLIIDGEYYLRLETFFEQGKSKSKLVHNFPGISHIKMKFSYVSKSGETLQYKLDAKGTKNNELPILSELHNKINSIYIEDICITYHLFGDRYCLSYSHDLPYLKLTKNGIYFDYANHSKLFNDKLYFIISLKII